LEAYNYQKVKKEENNIIKTTPVGTMHSGQRMSMPMRDEAGTLTINDWKLTTKNTAYPIGYDFVIQSTDGIVQYTEDVCSTLEGEDVIIRDVVKRFKSKHKAFGWLLRNYKQIQKETNIKDWHVVKLEKERKTGSNIFVGTGDVIDPLLRSTSPIDAGKPFQAEYNKVMNKVGSLVTFVDDENTGLKQDQ